MSKRNIHPSQHATRRDEMSKRTDWTIKQYPFWTAIHNETGEVLVARTREALMSKINEWDRA